MSDRKGLETTAMDKWYASHGGKSDRPRVNVHWPSSLPSIYVYTIDTGCDGPLILPSGPIQGRLTIGGVDFTMPYDEMELLFAAVMEEIQRGREQITAMQDRQRSENESLVSE